MNHWLFKTEAETFSWEMQKKRGAKGEPWSGVRNYAAAKHMKAMKKGDLGFFYHTATRSRSSASSRSSPNTNPIPPTKPASSVLSM